MLVLPVRSKRPRSSPSPDPAEQLSSPLDILQKRRRREEYWSDPILPHAQHAQPYAGALLGADVEADLDAGADGEGEEGFHPESSSTAWTRASINGRRSRQWQYLNAPLHSSQSQSHSQSSASASFEMGLGMEQASPLQLMRAASQPDPVRRGQMSSSPIRHHPPSSSPFKSSETQYEEWMRPEDMQREWGEEYAAQNSVLHDLHRARVGHLGHAHAGHAGHAHAGHLGHAHSGHIGHVGHTHLSAATPHSASAAMTLSPSAPTPEQYQQYAYRTQPPSSSTTHLETHTTPYRSTTTFPSSGPTPYRRGLPSSPLVRDRDADRHRDHDDRSRMGGECGEALDDSMEMDDEGAEQEEDVRRRYEETNRLLAELEVVRRQRWGPGFDGV